MEVSRDATHTRFGDRTPILCRRYPEQLLLCIRQTRQWTVVRVQLGPMTVSIVGDFSAAAVGNVFAQCSNAI